MPDIVNEGFGCTAQQDLGGSPSQMVRYIRSLPRGVVRITTISLGGSMYGGGAFTDPLLYPLYVLRGGAGLGVSGTSGVSVVPLVPSASAVIPGLPLVTQVVGGLEILYSALVPINGQQGRTLRFDPWELTANNGQVLAVCMGTLLNGTASPPSAVNTSVQFLNVLGVTDTVLSQGDSVLSGHTSRSLPRFGVSVP